MNRVIASESIVSPFDNNRLVDALRRDESGFRLLAQKLRQISGIHLANSEKNRVLMASRLAETMRRQGLASYDDVLQAMGRDAVLVKTFVEALTTNTTEFFREGNHFDFLARLIPALATQKAKEGKMEFRVLCVPCSTGQEPYSIAMVLNEALPNIMGWDVKILAADIDATVLQRAATGRYTEAEARGVPGLYRQKYFAPQPGRFGKELVVHDALRRMIVFAPFNLMAEPYPFKRGFDIIFCRNVLIYFERETAARVVHKLCQQLRPGGHLFLGHSEVGIVTGGGMSTVASAVYRKTT